MSEAEIDRLRDEALKLAAKLATAETRIEDCEKEITSLRFMLADAVAHAERLEAQQRKPMKPERRCSICQPGSICIHTGPKP